MKKTFLLFVGLFVAVTCSAVFREQNLDKTVKMLRIDLDVTKQAQVADIQAFDAQRKAYRDRLQSFVTKSEELALVLYSQGEDFTFGLAHACRQMSDIYTEFEENKFPFDNWRKYLNKEQLRYNGMISTLTDIDSASLSYDGRIDRRNAIATCRSMVDVMVEHSSKLNEDNQLFLSVEQRLEGYKRYTDTKYTELRQRIFVDGNISYFTILGSFGTYWRDMVSTMSEVYYSGQNASSEWNGRILLILLSTVLSFLVVWIAVSLFIGRVMSRWRFGAKLAAKKNFIAATVAMGVVSLVLIYLEHFVLERNFFIVAAGILVSFTWMCAVMLLSLTIRLKAENLRHGMLIHLPLVWIGFGLVIFRIALVPNILIDIFLSPFLIVSALIQLWLILRHKNRTPRSDNFYAWATFAVVIVAIVTSLVRYRLMSVELLMLWIILFTGIETLTCLYDTVHLALKRYVGHSTDIRRTWFKSLFNMLVMPLLVILMIHLSFVWAAHMFDLGSWFHEQYVRYIVDIENIAQISIQSAVNVVCLGFVVNYLLYITRMVVGYIYGDRSRTGGIALTMNITTIVVWGFYIIISMLILHINNTGLLTAIGGMTVGIGFALKDIINNVICGISLMLGRVRPGDIVECDGIRGKIVNINYQSTLIETIDGSIIAFLNDQLFAKNFKNLTRNHGFELVTFEVGVAYGTDFDKVKSLIIGEIAKLDQLDKGRKASVQLNSFGDNSINLKVVAWVPVTARGSSLSAIREMIYKVFNANNIEIPFPQRVVYMHQAE